MSRLLFDDEDYYFQINEALEEDKQFVLITDHIVDNRETNQIFKNAGRLWKTGAEICF